MRLWNGQLWKTSTAWEAERKKIQSAEKSGVGKEGGIVRLVVKRIESDCSSAAAGKSRTSSAINVYPRT